MKTIEDFIEFVIELTDEELANYFDGSSRRYFMQGGCFEFAKILQRYISESKIVINKEYNHCGIKYQGKVYDATGNLDSAENFTIAKLDDIKYMKDCFGIPEKEYVNGKKVSDYIIEKIRTCNIKQFLDLIGGEER